MPKTLKILLVAQTPPPYGGQAVMMQRVLQGRYEGVEMRHVRMHFSREMNEVGRFSIRKIIHLIAVIFKVAAARASFGATTLYYPPAGPDRIPIYRDLVLLIATRWMFRRTILHFQAGGLSEVYNRFSPAMRRLFRWAYFYPDVAIRTDRFVPRDPEFIRAKREFLIPNALEDFARQFPKPPDQAPGAEDRCPNILFVGVLRESKGVLDLLRAAAEVMHRGINFRVQLMGQFDSAAFEAETRSLAGALGVPIEFLGVMVGDAKYSVFARAQVFCLPSYFSAEASPVVLVEAMQFGLPIVSTTWRGIPAMVEDGVNGFLVPIRNSTALANALAKLLADPELAARLGANGRQRYEADYTLEAFHSKLQAVFNQIRG